MTPTTTTTVPEGEAVPSSFTLPWNTTRTMADVWGLSDAKPLPVSLAPRPRAAREPSEVKLPFAGKDTARYVLRDWQGSYLHQSCEGMTRDDGHAWRGSDRQLERVRLKYPHTKDLIASEVSA